MVSGISQTSKLVLACLVLQTVNACTKGSDASCAAHGSQYCCAKISYTHEDGSFSGHACANRGEIERYYANGETLTDDFGYSGLWYCDGAMEIRATLAAAAAVVALNMF